MDLGVPGKGARKGDGRDSGSSKTVLFPGPAGELTREAVRASDIFELPKLEVEVSIRRGFQSRRDELGDVPIEPFFEGFDGDFPGGLPWSLA